MHTSEAEKQLPGHVDMPFALWSQLFKETILLKSTTLQDQSDEEGRAKQRLAAALTSPGGLSKARQIDPQKFPHNRAQLFFARRLGQPNP